jgi:hypothetical protein
VTFIVLFSLSCTLISVTSCVYKINILAVRAKSQEPPRLEIADAEDQSDQNSLRGIDSVKSSSESLPKAVDESATSLESGSQVEAEEEAEEEAEAEAEEVDEDIEMASNPSLSHDNRSPVIFSQHSGPEEFALSELPEPALIYSENESTQSDIGSESEFDEEEDEDDAGKEYGDGNVQEDEVDDENEEMPAEESADETERINTTSAIQVPQSSPDLPGKAALPSVLKQISTATQNKRKRTSSSSDEDLNTQENVDRQLTSSLREVHSSNEAVKSTPTTPPSATARPKIKGGASLSAMNSQRPILGSSVSSSQINATKGQKAGNSESESESDLDSFDDSSSESSEDEGEDEPAVNFLSQRSQARKSNLNVSSSTAHENGNASDEGMRNDISKESAMFGSDDSRTVSQGRRTVKSKAGHELKRKNYTKFIKGGFPFSQDF